MSSLRKQSSQQPEQQIVSSHNSQTMVRHCSNRYWEHDCINESSQKMYSPSSLTPTLHSPSSVSTEPLSSYQFYPKYVMKNLPKTEALQRICEKLHLTFAHHIKMIYRTSFEEVFLFASKNAFGDRIFESIQKSSHNKLQHQDSENQEKKNDSLNKLQEKKKNFQIEEHPLIKESSHLRAYNVKLKIETSIESQSPSQKQVYQKQPPRLLPDFFNNSLNDDIGIIQVGQPVFAGIEGISSFVESEAVEQYDLNPSKALEIPTIKKQPEKLFETTNMREVKQKGIQSGANQIYKTMHIPRPIRNQEAKHQNFPSKRVRISYQHPIQNNSSKGLVRQQPLRQQTGNYVNNYRTQIYQGRVRVQNPVREPIKKVNSVERLLTDTVKKNLTKREQETNPRYRGVTICRNSQHVCPVISMSSDKRRGTINCSTEFKQQKRKIQVVSKRNLN